MQASMGNQAFVQSHLGAFATGAVRDLKIELALPLRVHLCLEVIKEPIPTHGVSLRRGHSFDQTRRSHPARRLLSTVVKHGSWQALVNVGKLH
jgi:hypothetical protein